VELYYKLVSWRPECKAEGLFCRSREKNGGNWACWGKGGKPKCLRIAITERGVEVIGSQICPLGEGEGGEGKSIKQGGENPLS